MVEWVLDVLIGYSIYLFRSVIRMVEACGSTTWPVVNATVTGSSCDATYLGALAEVTYVYDFQGEPFSGMHRQPCISHGSAEEYVARFPTGGDVILRVKPEEPEVSIVRDRDQTVGILG
jgi:hypothetical protein